MCLCVRDIVFLLPCYQCDDCIQVYTIRYTCIIVYVYTHVKIFYWMELATSLSSEEFCRSFFRTHCGAHIYFSCRFFLLCLSLAVAVAAATSSVSWFSLSWPISVCYTFYTQIYYNKREYINMFMQNNFQSRFFLIVPRNMVIKKIYHFSASRRQKRCARLIVI